MHRISFYLSLLALLTVSRAASAQAAAAEQLFEEGRAALAAGDLPTACARFRASDQIDPGAGTRASLGSCEEKRGKLASAWEAFKSSLAKLPPGDPRIAKVQERIDALAPRLPRLVTTLAPDAPADTVATEEGITIASASTAGVALPFDPGPHRLLVSAAGRPPLAVDVVLVEGQTLPFVLRPGPLAGSEAPSSGHTAGPWIVGGVGVALLVAGGITGALAVHQKNLNEAGCSSATMTCTLAGQQAANAGHVLGPLTTTALVAGVAGVAGSALWLGLRTPSGPVTGIGFAPLVGGATVRAEASW